MNSYIRVASGMVDEPAIWCIFFGDIDSDGGPFGLELKHITDGILGHGQIPCATFLATQKGAVEVAHNLRRREATGDFDAMPTTCQILDNLQAVPFLGHHEIRQLVALLT